MPAKAGIQAGWLRGCLVDSRFRGNDEFRTQLSSWAKPLRGSANPEAPLRHVGGLDAKPATPVDGAAAAPSERVRAVSKARVVRSRACFQRPDPGRSATWRLCGAVQTTRRPCRRWAGRRVLCSAQETSL
jgi:hypothetical protein